MTSVRDEGLSAAPELRPLLPVLHGQPAASIVLGGPMLRILYVNPAFCAAIGREEREVLGRVAAGLLPHLVRTGCFRALERARTERRAFRREARSLRLDPGRDPGFWDVEVTPLPGEAAGGVALLVQLRDVTARERSRREGLAARATLDALFAHIPEGLILAEGPEAHVRRVSAHGLALSGRREEEVLGHGATALPGIWQLLHADGTTPAGPEELPLARAARHGETVQHETWVMRRGDGTLARILCSAGPVRDHAGKVTGGIIAWRDVTGQHAAEAALAASEARYRALAEAGAFAVWTTGPEGSLDGAGWFGAIHPEDREQVRQCWEEAVARARTFEADCRLTQADGTWRWIAARAVPVRDMAGRITEWVGASADIHPRKIAEQALRASQERFRALAEGMPHLVWQADEAGEPEYMNRRMQGFTGLTPAAARGLPGFGLAHPEDAPRLAGAWRGALAEGREYGLDARLATPEGGWRWFRLQAAPVRDAEGRVRQWVGTCTDVEDRHRAEAAMQEALATQERLLRTAEHRIRNSLQLVASLLRLKAGRATSAAVRTALEQAVARVQAVAEAHRALQRSPDMRSVRLSDMLEELAAGATVQHPGADLRIEAPRELMLDADRAIPLALVLTELVVAAMVRAPEGRPPPPVLLLARAMPDGLEAGVTLREGAAEPDALSQIVVRALCRQIGATIVVEPAPEGGQRTVLRLAAEPPAREGAAPG